MPSLHDLLRRGRRQTPAVTRHYYVLCESCRRRQYLKHGLGEETLAAFLKAHARHIIDIQTAEYLNDELFAYEEEWPERPGTFDDAHRPRPEGDQLSELQGHLLLLTGQLEDLKLRYMELQIKSAGDPEKRRELVKGFRDLAIEINRRSPTTVIATGSVPLTQSDRDAIAQAAKDPWQQLPEEVRRSVQIEPHD